MRILKLILAVLALPLLGIVVATVAASPAFDMGSLSEAAQSTLACTQTLSRDVLADACGAGTRPAQLMGLSLAVLAGSIGLIVLMRIIALGLGTQRQLLAFGFGPVAFIGMLCLALIAFGHLGILTGAIAMLAQRFIAVDPSVILMAGAGMGLIGAGFLARALFGLFRSHKIYTAARPINLYEFPRLGLILRDVSKSLKARMPDNVLIGLQPTFYATSAQIHTPYMKGPLKGETLYLSLPLLSQFSEGELKAVIGHELGHFSGGDTAFSRRFAPAYMSLLAAAEELNDAKRPVTRVVTWPVRKLLEEVLLSFDVVRGRISRERERRADQSGAKVASPEDVTYSLLKCSVFGNVWHEQMIDSLNRGIRGRFSRNLVRNFNERVRLDVEREKISPQIRFAFSESIKHPTDSHPPTEDRVAAFGLSLVNVSEEEVIQQRFFAAPKVTDGLDNMRALEEDLTALHYHIHSGLWPDENEGHEAGDVFMSVLCDLLALMVTVDGKADDREIAKAEARAEALFGGFDADTFRDRCQHPDEIPALDQMMAFASKLLTAKGAANVKEILRNIAEADGEMHPEEAAMLARIEAGIVIEES